MITTTINKTVATMPSYRGFEWQDFRVSLKRGGIRKYLWFLPYFTGSDVNLTFTIETLSGEAKEFAYHWWCDHVGSDDVAARIGDGHGTLIGDPQSRITEKVNIPSVSSLGHYVIELDVTYPIGETSGESKNSGPRRIADFYALHRDALTVNLFFGLIVGLIGIVGTVLGVIIGWLLTRGSP